MNAARQNVANDRKPDRDAETRAQLQRLAWLLDSSIPLPGGYRIGLDPLLGLVPFLGDAAGVLISGYIVVKAARLGVPRSVLLRMVFNVAVEGVVGVVPLAGDLFDAAWKANQRNVRLMERHLDAPREVARSSRGFIIAMLLLIVLVMALVGTLLVSLVSWIVSLAGV